MNIKLITLVIHILLINTLLVQGQDYVTFRYDQNGNRISKTLTIEQLNLAEPEFPIIKPEKLEAAAESYDTGIQVYPNPMRDNLNIHFSGYDKQIMKKIEIFALSGSKVYFRENCEDVTVVDVSKLNSGVYILRIEIGLQKSIYKLIKSR